MPIGNLTEFEKPLPCPVCGDQFDGVTGECEHKPKSGDVVVCFNCATILRFSDEMTLQRADTTKLPLDVLDHLADIQAAIRKVKRDDPLPHQ